MYSGGALIDQIQDSTLTGTPVTNTFSRPQMNSMGKNSMATPPRDISTPSTPANSMNKPPGNSMNKPPMNAPSMDNTPPNRGATKGDDPPIIKEDSLEDSVEKPPPPPPTPTPPTPPPTMPKDDSYAQEYSILFVIYILIGFIYMIHSGVDIPTELNNWLYKNPKYINMTLSTLYFTLSIVYITYFTPKKESKNGEMYRRFVAFAIIATVMMGWFKIYQKDSITNITNPTFTNPTFTNPTFKNPTFTTPMQQSATQF